MKFFDDLKQRFFPQKQEDYYDDRYDQDYDTFDESAQNPAAQGSYGESFKPEERRSGLLGNTSRPEAQSVSVFTRTGRRLSSREQDLGSAQPQNYQAGFGTSFSEASSYQQTDGYQTAVLSQAELNTSAEHTSLFAEADSNKQESSSKQESSVLPLHSLYSSASYRATSTASAHAPLSALSDAKQNRVATQLPPYVLKPKSYDDVEMVIRRVTTGQPVILALASTNMDTAKRILDFSYGLACGIGGVVEEIAERSFVVLPAGAQLGKSYLDRLISDGTLKA